MFKISKCVKFPAGLLHELQQCCAGGWLNNLYVHFLAFAMQPSAGVSILWRLSIRHVEFVRWGSRDCSLLPDNTTGQRSNIATEQHDALKTHSLYMFYHHYVAGYQPVTFFLQFCIRTMIQIDIRYLSLSNIYLYLHTHIIHCIGEHSSAFLHVPTMKRGTNQRTNLDRLEAPLWSNSSYCTGSSSTMARCHWRSNVAMGSMVF